MEKKVVVHIGEEKYSKKPHKSQGGRISNQLSKSEPVEVSPRELAKLVGEEGRTVVLAEFKNKSRRKENFKRMQVAMLDFDDGVMTIEDMLEDEFIQEKASFIYKTFSHTDEHQRFRVVFILDRLLITNEEVASAYEYLMGKYPTSDPSTKDSSRFFYGGTEAIEVNYDNILEVDLFPEPLARVVRRKSTIQETNHAVDSKAFKYETPTWMAIKEGNKDEVASRWRKYGEGKSFKDETNTKDFFRSLDMSELLGLPVNPFQDIFKYEENPSMGIWKAKDTNTYLYTKLNEVGKSGGHISYDIIQVVAKLTGATLWGATQYLIDTTGVDFNISDELQEQIRQINSFKHTLRSDTLKEQHPEMYQLFGRYGRPAHVSTILDIMLDQMYEYNGEVQVVSWLSTKNLSKRLGVGTSTVERLLNLMALTGIVNKLSDNEVPEELMVVLDRNQTHYRDENGKYVERTHKRQRRSNVYTVPMVMDSFSEIEDWSISLASSGFTMRGFSYEYLLSTFGEETALKVFPQEEGRKISQVTKDANNLFHRIVMENIQEKGYMIVNEIVDETRKYADASETFTNYKYAQQEAEMIEAYGLKKVGLTNDLREELEITHIHPNARPQILIQA